MVLLSYAAVGHPESTSRAWGTNTDERVRHFPCDRHLRDVDDAYYRGIDVAAPPATVFRWLCQLRVAPYSYDWIDNLGRRSPPQLIAGLERLQIGQRFMGTFELVEFETDRSITLVLRGVRWLFGDVAVSYVVEAGEDGGSRLLVKIVLRYPAARRPVYRLVGPWLDLVMMRKQLLNLKRLSEARSHGKLPGARCSTV